MKKFNIGKPSVEDGTSVNKGACTKWMLVMVLDGKFGRTVERRFT